MRLLTALLGFSLVSVSAFAAGPVALNKDRQANPAYLVDQNGNIITSLGGGSGSSATTAATTPGTSATTANPVQGVTGGVPMPIMGSVTTPTMPATSPGTSATLANPVQGVTGGVPMPVMGSGSAGLDFSSNQASLPATVGATVGTSTYGGSGPFAAYILVASAPAAPGRASLEVDNITGASIVCVRSDGTAAAGSAPVNASWFVLGGGVSPNSQGGSWSSQTFRGRLQCWAASAAALPSLYQD